MSHRDPDHRAESPTPRGTCASNSRASLQDTERPIQFLGERGLQQLKPNVLIIDVSCDEGMGFPFSKPTSGG